MRRIIMAALAACAFYAVPAVAPQAIMTAVPLVQSVGADDAQAYLHVEDAYNRAQRHVWDYDCPEFSGCYSWPGRAGYQRISDSRVIVDIYMYNNRYGRCWGSFDIRGSDSSSTLEHRGYWAC